MCLGVDLFGFILSEILSASWTWISVSLPRLGKFSPIITCSKFSAFFSLSPLSGSPTMQMLVDSVLSQRSPAMQPATLGPSSTHQCQQPLNKAGPHSQPGQGPAPPSRQPHYNRRAHTAHRGAPLEHMALLTRGSVLLGPLGCLLHKASPPRLGNVTNLPNT